MIGRAFQRGFTLVELTVVLTILGLLTAGGLAVSASMVEKANYIDSRKTVELLEKALRDYYMVNGRLPCPASVNALPGSANFGREAMTDCATDNTVPPGTARDDTTPEPVRIGMVPVRTLGLTDAAAQDKFGARIRYAVTEPLTDSTQFSTTSGAITVLSNTGTPITSEAAYVLLSHGKDRVGANLYLTGATPAALTCAGTQLDRTNCDNTANFRDAPFNNGNIPAQWFDDIIAWAPRFHLMAGGATTPESSLWGVDGQHIYSVGTDGLTNTGNVGLGIEDPLHRLHVSGSAHIDTEDNRYLSLRNPNALANLRNWAWEDDTNAGRLALRTFNDDWTFKSNILAADHSTGNLGIGTTLPSQKLHLRGSAYFEPLTNFYSYMRNENAPAGSRNWAWQDFNNEGKLILRSYPDDWSAVKSSFLTMDNVTGNVGIGTESPTAQLHVLGQTILQPESDFYMYIMRPNTSGGAKHWAIQDSGNLGRLLFRSRHPDLSFKHTLLSMNHDTGNVGIGAMDASEKLEVTGNAIITGSVQLGTRLYIDPDYTYGSGANATSGSAMYGTNSSASHLTIFAQNNNNNGASISLAGRTAPFWGDGRITYRASYNNGTDGRPLHQFWRITSAGASSNLMDVKSDARIYIYGGAPQYPSDARLKTILGEIENPLEKIMKIRGIYYRWNENAYSEDKETVQIGVIAQEVQKVIPEAIKTDENGYLILQSDAILPVLLEAVKELKEENNALKNAISANTAPTLTPYDPFRDWRIWVLVAGVLITATFLSRFTARK